MINPDLVKIEVLEDGKTLFQMEDVFFYCETRSDFGVVQEIYDDGIYYFKQNKNKYIVIDIGMNTAMAALYFANNNWVVKVYGFEPFKETYIQALRNIELNKREIQNKIIGFNFGLDYHDSTKRFYYNYDCSGGMSTEHESDLLMDEFSEVKLKKASLVIESIIENHKEEKVMLKIDCEGSEYNIFTDLYDTGILRKVDVILMEWHDSCRNRLLEDQLILSGFCYIKRIGNDGRGSIYAKQL